MNGLSSLLFLITVPLLPLLVALGLTVPRLRRQLERLAPLAALPGLLLALTPQAGEPLTISWLFLGARLGLDDTGRAFLLLTALLWLAAGLYAHSYCRRYSHRRRFLVFFLITMSGNLGLTLALDMVSFYVFFSLMSFAAYGLIVHEGTDVSRRAGNVYLWLVVFGEVLLFAALILLAYNCDSLLLEDVAAALGDTGARHLIVGLLILSLGIKMGIIPLHFWLPLAHPAAPIPASAVLSGTMIKAGLLGLLRLLPLGVSTLPGWSTALICLGLLMAFFGVGAGLLQSRAKTLLAYSSISQIGFPLLGVGLGLAAPEIWPVLVPAISFYALHHGLAKGALFLGVGMSAQLDHPLLPRLATLMGLLIPALALSGAPWTSGAWAKAGLKPFLMHSTLPGEKALVILLGLAATGTTLLMYRLLVLLWRESGESSDRASAGMWTGWYLLISIAVLGGIQPDWLLATTSTNAPKLIADSWPLALGIVIAATVQYQRRQPNQLWTLPAGDIFVVVETVSKRLYAGLSVFSMLQLPGFPQQTRWQNLPVLLRLWDAEQLLRQLSVAGVMFILLLLVLLLL
ncbi:MAG: complex I subunit 5 family protein [Pelovirga sp.]